jgi:hypothetical protein
MRRADAGGVGLKRLIGLLLSAAWLAEGAVDGVVTNQTTGKPQSNVTVTLYKLGSAGMESVESVKSGADGRFAINQPVEGPHLVQTAWDGVTYNHMLPPGSPTSGLSLQVYDAAAKLPAEARVSAHMILLEPASGQLNVSESIIYQNSGKLAFNNPAEGTLRFFVASATGRIAVRATAPQGMPVERAAEKTATQGVYKVDFPVKPGETRFDLNYTAPFTSPGEFTGKVLHGGAAVRIVAPNGVTLTGDSLRMLGQEPSTLASIYEVNKPEFTVQVEGTGSLQAQGGAGDEEEDAGAGIRQIRPRLYDRFLPVLGLALLIFFFGFLLLYRRRAASGDAPSAVSPPAQSKTAARGKRRG